MEHRYGETDISRQSIFMLFLFFPFLKHNLSLKLKVMFKKTYDDKNICIISDLPNASMKSPGLRDAR